MDLEVAIRSADAQRPCREHRRRNCRGPPRRPRTGYIPCCIDRRAVQLDRGGSEEAGQRRNCRIRKDAIGTKDGDAAMHRAVQLPEGVRRAKAESG